MTGRRSAALLAGQALVVIGALGREFEFRGLGGVVGLDPAREAGALDRFRAEIIERFDAEFPRAIVEHEQVPFLDIGGDEEVQARRLVDIRSEEHTSELQSLMRISYAVFCLKKKKYNPKTAQTGCRAY